MNYVPSCSSNVIFGNVGSGTFGPAWGVTGYIRSEDLSNTSVNLTYRPYDQVERLSLNGPVKQIALLILQQVMERKELGTYTYGDGEMYVPKTITWGPLIFDTHSLTPNISQLNIKHSEEELQMINIINEIERVKKLKAFL